MPVITVIKCINCGSQFIVIRDEDKLPNMTCHCESKLTVQVTFEAHNKDIPKIFGGTKNDGRNIRGSSSWCRT